MTEVLLSAKRNRLDNEEYDYHQQLTPCKYCGYRSIKTVCTECSRSVQQKGAKEHSTELKLLKFEDDFGEMLVKLQPGETGVVVFDFEVFQKDGQINYNMIRCYDMCQIWGAKVAIMSPQLTQPYNMFQLVHTYNVTKFKYLAVSNEQLTSMLLADNQQVLCHITTKIWN